MEIALIISIMLNYIIFLVPAREHIESYILHCFNKYNSTIHTQSQHTQHNHTYTINIIRSLLVIFTALISLVTPRFGSMLGNLTDAFQSYVLPPLIYFKTESNFTIIQQIFYLLIFFWGTATVIIYSISNIFQIITK